MTADWAGLRAFAIPMPVKFRGVTVREGALIEGPAGWGEFSPFAEYGPRECARWLASALESAAGQWPAPVRDRIPVNVTVPAIGPEQAIRIVASSGCRTAKVKVAERGQPEAHDIERVEAVREALGPSGRIRVDANGGWQTGQAIRMLRRLAAFGLEYAEQPCASLEQLAEVRRAVDVPVAADESIRRAEDPLRVRAAGAADIVVLKVQPLGGVHAALQVAEACGLPVVVSSAVDTSVGLAAGVALAAALPELPYACGLGTMSLLAGDVTADPLVAEQGELPVRRPMVDLGQLARFEADPGPWRERAAAAAQFLGEVSPASASWASLRRQAAPVNPSTAFGLAFCDELTRCGLQEAVLAPGSRSTPLAMALFELERSGRLRLHVRLDERSASFTALGLAKASRRPVAVLCTSGTAAANFHPAVIEADESAVPLLVLTADRPPELSGTGANQAIDQIKLYGSAVRWFCTAGLPEQRPGMTAYWRSLACQAWARAAGGAGGLPGPVHLNLPLRDPLTPELPSAPAAQDWPESLDGRPGGQPWTRFEAAGAVTGQLELPWAERGVLVCGDGDYDAAALISLAEQAGWPVLAEPSSGARSGPNALPAYQYLLATPEFAAAHRPDVLVSAGRPGLSRPQSALLAGRTGRHVVISQGPGRWSDPQRAATDVTAGLRLSSWQARDTPWLQAWRRADDAARRAVDAILDSAAETGEPLSEPRLARDLVPALPEDALLWVASSLPIRDIDFHGVPRADIRILASRGASGIDGTVSSAIGAALAHDGPAFALIGDLAFLHDTPGLALGASEPRPDLCLIVVNNDGGGIFSSLEQAGFTGSFERLFGTPHGASLEHLAATFGLPYQRLEHPEDLPKALAGTGLRIVEAQTDRAAGAPLRGRLRAAAAAAIRSTLA